MIETPPQKAEAAVRELLEFIGEDPEREGLADTPRRVRKAWQEMCSGYSECPEEILSRTFDETTDDMVLVRQVPFNSTCEHHMLPFHGIVTVGYMPRERVVGLSKIPRVIHCFAKRLQIQERLTNEIAHAIDEHLEPWGVGVIIKAYHTCMSARGIKSAGDMVTSCLLGSFREGKARQEFLQLAGV